MHDGRGRWSTGVLSFGIMTEDRTYSAFANSCPLQTDAFLFPLIHSHNALLSSNTTVFFNTKKEHIYMCSYTISVVYIYNLSYLV